MHPFTRSPWSQRKEQKHDSWLEEVNTPEKQDKKEFVSPKPKSAKTDRFIPSQVDTNFYNLLLNEKQQEKSNNENNQDPTQPQSPNTASNNNDLNETLREESQFNTYTSLLKQNILTSHHSLTNSTIKCSPQRRQQPNQENVLKFKSNIIKKKNSEMILSYSPFKFQEQQNFTSDAPIRKISKQPYKILDAPRLRDDFYFNLLDWSSNNLIAIGLDNSVYTWSAKTNEAYKLAEFPNQNIVTSLKWNARGNLLATGDDKGDIRLFDADKNKLIRKIENHSYRVGCLGWNGNLLTSGSRDSKICLTDIRCSRPVVTKFIGHKQEVCGLKWSYDENTLASGGNDNKVYVWSLKMQKELTRFGDHVAAVKALTWSPHQHNLLVSGGGTTDKTMKFWNINLLKMINSVDTGSQICNMEFSKNINEIVTTHGFSMNQVAVWQVNNMQRIATLYGHTYRVLYLAMSPCGENIVTGSGDETLRFWKVFPPGKIVRGNDISQSVLDPKSFELR